MIQVEIYKVNPIRCQPRHGLTGGQLRRLKNQWNRRACKKCRTLRFCNEVDLTARKFEISKIPKTVFILNRRTLCQALQYANHQLVVTCRTTCNSHLPIAKTSMKPLTRKTRYKHQFDFEVGYLVKSPCKGCEKRPLFPKCSEKCDMLDRIQTVLTDCICCSRSR